MADWTVAAYLLLFAGVAFALVFGSLLLGRLLRPHQPSAAKLEPYECGEPAVGTTDIQFDLRFYVVALVFIIFEVELAFFFPWADVFGKLAQGHAVPVPVAVRHAAESRADHSPLPKPLPGANDALPAGSANQAEVAQSNQENEGISRLFALAALADIAVFFGVLLVGFAYVWSKGDLEWVKAMPRPVDAGPPTPAGAVAAVASATGRR